MGRKSHVRMKITDFKVQDETIVDVVDGKQVRKKTGSQIGIVGIIVRKGKYEFKLAYGIRKEEIAVFDWDEFKIRVYKDSLKKIANQEFEDKALQNISDFIGVELELD